MDIKTEIFQFLSGHFSHEAATFIAATLPIFELRLAVPLALISFKFGLLKAYVLSYLGNLLPVLPLLVILKYFFTALKELPFVGKFFSWWFASVARRSALVERYGFWGLVLFVAIPLPVTGAWTGTVAATLFKIDIRKAFCAVALGVAIAGIIMTIVSVLAREAATSLLSFT